MPRKTKEADVIKEEEKKAKKATKTTAAKKTTRKTADKATETKKTSTTKKVAKTDASKKSTSKTVTTKKAPAAKKATKSAKSTVKKAPKTKSTAAKAKTSKKNKEKILDFSPEYYDLPFRYNKTVVKILAQTPTNLFIYWEISDEDREALKKQYGEYFFEITKPVLIVHNETLGYSFEVGIDDFANSWYLHVNDSDSEYKVELGRRPIPVNYNYMPEYNIEENGPILPVETPYIYISSSNELDAPNDRILFNITDKIYFKNVKTNQIIEKDIRDFKNIYKDGNFVDIYELYRKLYREEIFNDEIDLNNPSSGNPSSGNFSIRYR